MDTNIFWTCKTCGSRIPGEQVRCPKCSQESALRASAEHPQRISVPWVKAVSVPAVLLGLLAFFLPWVQVSCGPAKVSFSGYELASGKSNEKIDALGPQTKTVKAAREKSVVPNEDGQQKAEYGAAYLWAVFAGLIVLLLLAIRESTQNTNHRDIHGRRRMSRVFWRDN